MRRALREELPALSKAFGVMPWHLDGGPAVLTFGEIDAYRAAIADDPLGLFDR